MKEMPDPIGMFSGTRNRSCPRDLALLGVQARNEHPLHQCELCRGVWIPGSVVASLLGHAPRPRSNRAMGLQCPDDKSLLVSVRYKRVEVDVCSQCGGVWLDAGELDTILNRPSRTSQAVEIGADVAGEALSSLPDLIGGAGELAGDAASAVLEFLAEALSGF